jgi:hypothetical protein
LNVAPRPFKLGVVNAVMFGNRRKRVVPSLIGHKTTVRMNHTAQVTGNAPVVQRRRASACEAVSQSLMSSAVRPPTDAQNRQGEVKVLEA